VPKNEFVKIVARDHPVTPVRVASVFADVKHGVDGESDRMVDYNQTSFLDKKREVIKVEDAVKSEDGCTYYEQYQAPVCWVKLGLYHWV
jgi:hypothetical protein